MDTITAGLTVASCGIVYWGWDLAGFSGPVPEAGLYLRAAAASTFMPIMQYHSESNHHQRPLRDRTSWYIAETTGEDRVVPVFNGSQICAKSWWATWQDRRRLPSGPTNL